MTYYIYEIPGEKNGATKDWEIRRDYNFRKYEIEPIIVETMEGPDTEDMWQVVGDREWYYADLNGYKRGEHYLSIRRKSNHNNRVGNPISVAKNLRKGNTKEGATKGGYACKGIPKRKVECPRCGRSISGSNLVVHLRRKNPCA